MEPSPPFAQFLSEFGGATDESTVGPQYFVQSQHTHQ
jgi:hypothetical protein